MVLGVARREATNRDDRQFKFYQFLSEPITYYLEKDTALGILSEPIDWKGILL